MMITKPAVVGAVIALAGHALAVGVTVAVALSAGGGPNADLDAGDTVGVLMASAFAYGIAQVLLLGLCIASWRRLGPEATSGLTAGWILGLAASTYYVCGGFGT